VFIAVKMILDKILFRERLFSRRWFRSWLSIAAGCFVVAAAFVLFITPYRIVPGGVYGIGVVLHHLFPAIPVGTFGLMLDAPLLLIAFWLFGNRFGAKTIVAALLTPLMMNALTALIGEDPATMLGGGIDLTGDVLLSSLFGGVLCGVGLGLILRSHATSGGTDIVAMIVHRYTRLPIARCLLIVDSCVVVLGLIVLRDWRIPLYSLVTIYVTTQVMDYILDGGGSNKLLFILSDRYESIRDLILGRLERGGTYIHSTGMYSMQDKKMIFVVINRKELPVVQDHIKQVDPSAFMVVMNAHEIYGEGFKSLLPED
jgi:uncharacterized membrane-anchored protein YitT (DUF2179 family)